MLRSLAAAILVLVSSGCSRQEATPASTATPHMPLFRDVAIEAGLGDFHHENGARGAVWFPETMGAGGGFADLDGDGLLDVLLVSGSPWEGDALPRVQVYRNQGGGRFARETAREPDGPGNYGFGLAVADYDGDGDSDVYYTALGRDALFRNDAGRLVDVSDGAGIPDDGAWSTAAVFLDADGDGWVDLYVARYVAWTPESDIYCTQDGDNKGYCTPDLYPAVPGVFYRNEGDGTFRDATAESGLDTARGKTLGAIALDHNRDGRPDLMLANDTEQDQLFLNLGDGTFEEVGVSSGIAFDEMGRARAGMGVAAGVVDDTGEETLFVGNFSSEMIGVYRHLGNDVFLDRAASSRIGQPSLLTLTFGLALADFDLDADLDLFAANGHVQPHIAAVKENVAFRQHPHLFANRGDGTFVDMAEEAGMTGWNPWLARAAAWGDYDGDGDPDLLVTENDGPVHLLRNESTGSTSLTVLLEGARPNTLAIGASVQLWTSGSMQSRYVRSGGSYLSQSQTSPLFALPESPDSLVVMWPSGHVSRVFEGLAGPSVSVREGAQ